MYLLVSRSRPLLGVVVSEYCRYLDSPSRSRSRSIPLSPSLYLSLCAIFVLLHVQGERRGACSSKPRRRTRLERVARKDRTGGEPAGLHRTQGRGILVSWCLPSWCVYKYALWYAGARALALGCLVLVLLLLNSCLYVFYSRYSVHTDLITRMCYRLHHVYIYLKISKQQVTLDEPLWYGGMRNGQLQIHIHGLCCMIDGRMERWKDTRYRGSMTASTCLTTQATIYKHQDKDSQ